MADVRRRREFRRTSFACVRDWVHFCVEFDLRVCGGCRQRARIGIGAPRDWRCGECTEGTIVPIPLHPDLWRAIDRGEETQTSCPVCRRTVALGDCWISDDGRRLYCAEHLRPIGTTDRLRRARHYLGRGRLTSQKALQVPSGRFETLSTHFSGNRCASCPHNGRGVYQGGRLVDIDGDRSRCTSAPDALNCADVEH